jgi:tetratricopeptide (TPR) repeat protein
MDEEIYLLIDRYLANELSAEERRKFDENLRVDTELAEKVRVYRVLSENLRSKFTREQEEIQLRESLSVISQLEFGTEKSARVISIRWYHWAAAASVALLAVVWFYTRTAAFPEYAQYAVHEPLSLAERGDDSLKHQAEQAFNSKQYARAVAWFDRLLAIDPNDTELQLYKGVSLLELDRISEAELLFNGIKDSNSVYKDKAIWYLALSALKQKHYDQCKILLEKLPRDSEDYDAARKILDKL